YLKPIQISNRIIRQFRRPRSINHPAPLLRELRNPGIQCITKPRSFIASDACYFLNIERKVTGQLAWNDPAIDTLWLYNLHYFDDLSGGSCRDRLDLQADWIARWVSENPPSEGIGWEPYPISLRTVNWIKWHLLHQRLTASAIQSLAVQARHLMCMLEFHLLGNHLLANAKALVFLGVFFEGGEAESWLKCGLQILDKELNEQILPDGGHFELSPMYHSIIAEDLLDLIWLARLAPKVTKHLLPTKRWRDTAEKMISWLQKMCHPDGDIALFNDASLNTAASLSDLSTYAESLGLNVPVTSLDTGIYSLPNSGFVRLQAEDATVFFDMGEIGPSYLPAHGHADILSLEMSLFGDRFFINGGTSHYKPDREREIQRGTAAHSTVVVDELNSSEIWGGFRVARRARPRDRDWSSQGNILFAAATHDGFQQQTGGALHRRTIKLSSKSLTVEDTLTGSFSSAKAFFHLAPECAVKVTPGSTKGLVKLSSGNIVEWNIHGGQISVQRGVYHPQFGVSLPIQSLVISFSEKMICSNFTWH
ncbi:MAG: heparinase II/III family protein, partial [Gammaproteobacteria bacterium]|nr:heparinase II/III family protein [Gammaproteobacteria bacterium]